MGVGREEERFQGQLLKLDELLDVDVLEEGAGLVVHGRRQAQEEAQLILRVGLRQKLGAARKIFVIKL